MGLGRAISEGFKNAQGGIADIIWDIKNLKSMGMRVGLVGGILGSMVMFPHVPAILAIVGGAAAGPVAVAGTAFAAMYAFKFAGGFIQGLGPPHEPQNLDGTRGQQTAPEDNSMTPGPRPNALSSAPDMAKDFEASAAKPGGLEKHRHGMAASMSQTAEVSDESRPKPKDLEKHRRSSAFRQHQV